MIKSRFVLSTLLFYIPIFCSALRTLTFLNIPPNDYIQSTTKVGLITILACFFGFFGDACQPRQLESRHQKLLYTFMLRFTALIAICSILLCLLFEGEAPLFCFAISSSSFLLLSRAFSISSQSVTTTHILATHYGVHLTFITLLFIYNQDLFSRCSSYCIVFIDIFCSCFQPLLRKCLLAPNSGGTSYVGAQIWPPSHRVLTSALGSLTLSRFLLPCFYYVNQSSIQISFSVSLLTAVAQRLILWDLLQF